MLRYTVPYTISTKKEDNGINLITLIDKLSVSVQHKSYRERIPLQVANLGSKTINTVSSKIKYFGILCAKKETVAGQKRATSKTLTNLKHLIQLR